VLGFIMAAASGVSMLSANASEYVGNPFLPLKLGAIVLGGGNVAVLQTLAAWKARAAPEQSAVARRQLAIAGGVSLLCWLTAVASGRMLGYW
jgi:hypothetical protein